MKPDYRGAPTVPVFLILIALVAGCPGVSGAGEARPAGPTSAGTVPGMDPAPSAAARRYAFGGASRAALSVYRRGWVAILRDGRWAEAERLYREALTLDPDFTIAKSVLARITDDTRERDTLYREVQTEQDKVDPVGRLILHTYQNTLELFARRETGNAPDTEERRAMAERAVADYGAFLARHPGEWSVMIEYVEWVHALDGPGAALEAIEVLRASGKEAGLHSSLDFSYFPAWFHAELGDLATARRLARAFRDRIGDPVSPQPAFLDAYLYLEAGDLEAAAKSVELALALEPRHLLAQRLQRRIDRAQCPPA